MLAFLSMKAGTMAPHTCKACWVRLKGIRDGPAGDLAIVSRATRLETTITLMSVDHDFV